MRAFRNLFGLLGDSVTTATSAFRPRGAARFVAATAGLGVALALTACSGDSGDDSEGGSATPGANSSATASATASSDGGSGGTSASGPLEGSWLATTDGKAVALVITGKQAGLFSTEGTVCNGTAGEEAGMQMIHLRCTGGNKDRADGMVSDVGSSTMKVAWEGFKTETYMKSEGGKLPSGLPTASLSAS